MQPGERDPGCDGRGKQLLLEPGWTEGLLRERDPNSGSIQNKVGRHKKLGQFRAVVFI
jgi:hypothetical protein